MRYAVFVTGPAGAGKSTFCANAVLHLQTLKRTVHWVNLDPAADPNSFEFAPTIDIKDLVSLEDVMEELGLGPNGGLVYCLEYLLQNFEWLDEELGEYEDDYLIIDCPGQIELYTHHPILPTLVSHFQQLGIRVAATYLLESQFMEDKYKYFSGVLSAMSAMVNLEVPWINVMSKMDLISTRSKDTNPGRNGLRTRRDIARYLDPDPLLMSPSEAEGEEKPTNRKFHALNEAIVRLIEENPLVSFLPLDLTVPDSIERIISHIDYTMQYGEDEEPKEPMDMDAGDFAAPD